MRHCDNPLDVIFDSTAEDCLEQCSANEFCKKAHWHPDGQIWSGDHHNANRTNCWMWEAEAQTCEEAGWSLEATVGSAYPGAQMIRCLWCKRKYTVDFLLMH